MEDVQQATNLEAIMDSLQTLATSVDTPQSQVGACVQGGHIKGTRPSLTIGGHRQVPGRDSPRHIGASIRRQVQRGSEPPPPDYRETEEWALAQQATSGVNCQAMAAFPTIFTVFTYRLVTTRARLEHLSTRTLAYWPPMMVCIKELDPHIWVLWGLQLVTPFYASATRTIARARIFCCPSCAFAQFF